MKHGYMPYTEEEILALNPGIQRMMARCVLAGVTFDKWMSGGNVIYESSVPRCGVLCEDGDLSTAIVDTHILLFSTKTTEEVREWVDATE